MLSLIDINVELIEFVQMLNYTHRCVFFFSQRPGRYTLRPFITEKEKEKFFRVPNMHPLRLLLNFFIFLTHLTQADYSKYFFFFKMYYDRMEKVADTRR